MNKFYYILHALENNIFTGKMEKNIEKCFSVLLYLNHYFPVENKKKRSLSTIITELPKGWLHVFLKNKWISVRERYFSVSPWTETDGIFCRSSALLQVIKRKAEEMLLWSFKHGFLKDWNSPLDIWDLTKSEISDFLQHYMKSPDWQLYQSMNVSILPWFYPLHTLSWNLLMIVSMGWLQGKFQLPVNSGSCIWSLYAKQ